MARTHGVRTRRPEARVQIDVPFNPPYATSLRHLLRIDPAHLVIGPGGALLALGQHVLEIDPPFLEAGGVDIGEIVANHIHAGLMILQPGHTGI